MDQDTQMFGLHKNILDPRMEKHTVYNPFVIKNIFDSPIYNFVRRGWRLKQMKMSEWTPRNCGYKDMTKYHIAIVLLSLKRPEIA